MTGSIVLIHAVRSSATMWRGQAKRLRKHDFEVIVPDLPGHGRRQAEDFTPEGALATIDEVVARCAEPPLLVGLSLGGYLTLHWAARNPGRLAGVVAADCTVVPGRMLASAYGLWLASRDVIPGDADARVRRSFARRNTRKAAKHYYGGGRASGVVRAVTRMIGTMDLLEDVAAIDVPITFINGEHDVFRRHEDRFLEAARDGRLEILWDAGHVANLNRPKRFARLVRKAARRARKSPSASPGSANLTAVTSPTIPQELPVITDEDHRDGPLAGRRIGVTAHRRAEDQITALTRQGAVVLHAPTMRIVPAEDDAALISETEQLLAADPAALLVTTGQGFTSWREALPAKLRERVDVWLGAVPIWCRGPKARGAVRGAGFADAGIPAEETTAALVGLALEQLPAGAAVGLQRHGYLHPRERARLEDAGHAVHVVQPYRWELGEDRAAVARLIDAILDGELDDVTFTAAPAVEALLTAAEQQGRRDALLDTLREGRTRAVCVGHLTAQPLLDQDVPTVWPERERLGGMVRMLVAEQAAR